MSLTIEILQTLGSPFDSAAKKRQDMRKIEDACQYSKKNRMLFLYLDTLNAYGQNSLSTLYQKENARRIEMENAVIKVSKVLTRSCISHAIFKTIRPYKSTTVDIDTLIFADRTYLRSIEVMRKAGYELVVRGPRSTTLWDKEANIGVDLYEQIAVSFITYIDKQTLTNHVTTKILGNGNRIETMAPEADLACIIAHSVIKEQMYTLSEYYTFLHYLTQMNVSGFLQIVKKNNLTLATKTHAAITALLHETTHGNTPSGLQQILDCLGIEDFETTRLIANDFDTPHKYHPITVARSLLEIAKGRETRRSMTEQAIHMFDPKISRDFLKKLFNHILRQTY